MNGYASLTGDATSTSFYQAFAHLKGEDVVINLAKAWMEQLFLPSQCLE